MMNYSQSACVGCDVLVRFGIALTQVNRYRKVSTSCAGGNATRCVGYDKLTVNLQYVFPRIVIIRLNHVYSAHRK
jgi:hypothetical protein